jgi:hypothetical protein
MKKKITPLKKNYYQKASYKYLTPNLILLEEINYMDQTMSLR